jgi:hypothetical protein
MAPVFIVAAPRSGTTWLVQALNAHPDVYATELRAFGEHADLVQDQGAQKPRLRITLDEYINALLNPHAWAPLGPSRHVVRDELLRDVYATIQGHALRQTGKRVFVDKFTPFLGTADHAVGAIARLFPGAKVVMLVRDGRDVAVSGVMHWLTKTVVGGRLSAQQRRRRAFFLEKAAAPPERFFTDAELEEWTSLWRQPIDAVQAHAAALDCLVVRYERMSCDLGSELTKICEFVGVDASAQLVRQSIAASTFEIMSGGRHRGDDAPGQHVRKGVVGDWRRYFTAADAALFDRLAGNCLIDWGYESDHEWATRVPAQLVFERPAASHAERPVDRASLAA